MLHGLKTAESLDLVAKWGKERTVDSQRKISIERREREIFISYILGSLLSAYSLNI